MYGDTSQRQSNRLILVKSIVTTWTHEIISVIFLEFEQFTFTIRSKDAEGMTNSTVKILNFQTHLKCAVNIILKVEQSGFSLVYCIQKMQRELQTV